MRLEVIMDDLDAMLLGKALAGDASAAPFLVSCYGESLLGYAHAHAPDLSDAAREDIVELAIEAGVRAIHRFDRSKGTLRSWFRGQIRFQTLAWRRVHPVTGTLEPDIVESAPPTTETAAPTERLEALRRAVQTLSPDDQLIVALRTTEGLGYSEIASRLSISEDSARKRHSRALTRLREAALREPQLLELCTADADEQRDHGEVSTR